MKHILHNRKGVTVLEGLIALLLLSVVAVGTFGVLLSSSRKASIPDVREELMQSVERTHGSLRHFSYLVMMSACDPHFRDYLGYKWTKGKLNEIKALPAEYFKDMIPGDPFGERPGPGGPGACILPGMPTTLSVGGSLPVFVPSQNDNNKLSVHLSRSGFSTSRGGPAWENLRSAYDADETKGCDALSTDTSVLFYRATYNATTDKDPL